MKVLLADAKIGIAALRRRRVAIDCRRACVDVNGLAIESLSQHLATLSRVQPKPASRFNICKLSDCKRRFHAIAGAIAPGEFGVRCDRQTSIERKRAKSWQANHALMLVAIRARVNVQVCMQNSLGKPQA